MELDKIDRNILSLVQADCRLSAQVIGEKVGLSTSAVQRRINQLKQQGVIVSDVSIVDPKKVGRELSMIIDVVLENDTVEVVKAFVESVLQYPSVMQFYYVAGSTDYVVIFSAQNMQEFDEFTQAVFFANPHVKTFSTKVVIKPIKVGLSIPI